MVKKGLDPFRKVEISKRHRCGGEQHSYDFGSSPKPRMCKRISSHVIFKYDSTRIAPPFYLKIQGIYTLLVQGRSITENIRSHLIHLSSSKRFLRASLFTRWGLYVWKDLDYFNVDNHLLNPPCSFRGRSVTETNIQVGFIQQYIFYKFNPSTTSSCYIAHYVAKLKSNSIRHNFPLYFSAFLNV